MGHVLRVTVAEHPMGMRPNPTVACAVGIVMMMVTGRAPLP